MLIHEHYETAFEEDIELKEQYIDQVWQILQDSYKDIGGLQIFGRPQDLLKANNMWKMVTRNGKVVAVVIYKRGRGGRKLVAGGSNGSAQGKKDFYKICSEDVRMPDRQTWGEVSGSLEGILLFKYDAIPIPSYLADRAIRDMNREIKYRNPDGFHYTRDIGGDFIEKIMFGNVPEQYRLTNQWNIESDVYKQVFKMRNKEHPDEVEDRKNKHKNN